jgi:hydroxymethylpyrimidine pyrophosphatase-like HAD family hydrolase
MERYDLVFHLYADFDAEALRDVQDFLDVFPPVDSRTALDYWQDASDTLERRKDEIRGAFDAGDEFAEIAARATRDQAFTALDLHSKYGRGVNALVLDVDETLRSAGRTDNEIPRATLHLLTEFHEAGVPIVICTGQTLENVKGFMIQGLGNELVHSGSFGIVYEAGTGVFTPGHGSKTKQLLYDGLDPDVRDVFDEVRSRVLPQAPDDLRESVHLQGNEFNVTLKPNFDIGSDEAEAVIDRGLVYLLDLLGRAVRGVVATGDGDAAEETADVADDEAVGTGRGDAEAWARAYYAEADPEIAAVLDAEDAAPAFDPADVPEAVESLFERIDVAYYHADAAEIGSLELNKTEGVKAALDVLDVDDPFVLVMGDSKSDLRVMRWAAEADAGIAAAPEHASADVLDHVRGTDELVYDRGDAASALRIAYVMNLFDEL